MYAAVCLALLLADASPPPTSATVRAVWLADLDPDRLAVLADALEEAGCDNADLLSHLRGPGPHVRGCWALDLLLGKE